ncbi:MAG: 50S ribosomal protein L4 [Minisyncoccia bacterium]
MATKKTTKAKEPKKAVVKEASNSEATIYDASGKKSGSIKLPENIFGLPWNASLMHQVVTSMQDNARTRVAHAKGRGDVRGGGKKPWQQKGTGRARVGSSRSPIWKGGGVTHGPIKDKMYGRDIPKKMRAKALMLALSRKMRDGEIVFVNSFGLETPKTAAAKKVLVSLSKVSGMERLVAKPKNAALVAFADPTPAGEKSFRNIGNVKTVSVRNLNPLAVLGSTYLVIENPEAAVAILETRAAKVGSAKKEE